MSTLALWIAAIFCAVAAYALASRIRQGLLPVVVLILLFGLLARGWYQPAMDASATSPGGSGPLAVLVVTHVLIAFAGVAGYAVRQRHHRR